MCLREGAEKETNSVIRRVSAANFVEAAVKATNSPTPTSGRRPLSARARIPGPTRVLKHQRTLFTAEPIELARASARAISAALFTTCPSAA